VGNGLSEHVYTGRAYEPTESRFVESFLQEGDFAVDIGANVGYFSMLMSHAVGAAGCVASVEPGSGTYLLLSETIKALRLQNIVALPFAAWNCNELLTFFESTVGDDAQQSFFQRNKTVGKTTQRVVPAFSSDHLFATSIFKNKSPCLIKIDVEGAEPHVIEGLRSTILDAKPILLVEMNDESLEAAGSSRVVLIKSLSVNHDLYYTKLCWPSWWTDQDKFERFETMPNTIREANLLCIPKHGVNRERALTLLASQ